MTKPTKEKIDAAISAIQEGVPTMAQIDLAIRALEAYKPVDVEYASHEDRTIEVASEVLFEEGYTALSYQLKGVINGK